MKNEFQLYPTERSWWSFNDYRCVLGVTRRLHPRLVLEFGPGSSTLSLLEGGAGRIFACEDNPEWERVYRTRLEAQYPARVKLVAYTWADPLLIPSVDPMRFDLALIDGPLGTERRGVVLDYCLDRCRVVLICCEDLKGPGLRGVINATAARRRCHIEVMETGPLAGSFALLTP